ncbi:MAG: hypothetical protein U9R23_00690 [Candidatus Cloacimonadota bacterium]|nr:hypothetical protein [Candidatus Cloacimonadota bacterium]
MKKLSLFLLGIFIFYLPQNIFAESKYSYDTWQADIPQVQLDKEGVDDEIGFGRIFIPAMSKPKLEPEFSVYQNGKTVKVGFPIGQSCFLKPGNYTIVFGSATSKDKKIQKKVTVEEGETKIISPTWSGLIVKIIDQNRNYIRLPYEIYDINDYKTSAGMKYSADENKPGEEQETWILEPGTYKVIKYGETPKTFINFATIQLLPGELYIMTVVLNNETNNFMGAGILPEMFESDKIHKWIHYTSIKGSFLLNADNSANKEQTKTNITLSSKLENELKYDEFPHYFNSRQTINLGFTKEQDQDFRIYSNSIQLPNTYIYYLFKSFGFYTRFRIDSNIFPTNFYLDSLSTVCKHYQDGTIDTLKNIDKVQITPVLYPISLEEGFGLNLTLLNTNRSNLYIKTGLGMAQTLNNHCYEQDPNDNKIFNELESIYLNGIEGNIVGDFQITNDISDWFEFYTLYPFEKDRAQVYRFENTLTFRISSYVSLDYKLTIKREELPDWIQLYHNLSLDITFISF